MTETPLITLMTDFGTDDVFVGVMKGVIAGICPTARVIDVTHAVPPQDVTAAAFLLAQSYRWFPSGTVHVVVVDPGVGTERRIVAVEAAGQVFLAPDNGVLTLVAEQASPERIVEVKEPKFFLPDVSGTFHGRDIFAPVAAHIAAGVSLEELGPPIKEIATVEILRPERLADGSIRGAVVWTDRFGNLITNIPADILGEDRQGIVVRVGDTRIEGLHPTYGEGRPGEVVAVIDSFGYLEIAVNRGSAARELGLCRGETVIVSLR